MTKSILVLSLVAVACSSSRKAVPDAGTPVGRDLGIASDMPAERLSDGPMDLVSDTSTDAARACVYRDESCASTPCCAPAVCVSMLSGRICAESYPPPIDGAVANTVDAAVDGRMVDGMMVDGKSGDLPVPADTAADVLADTLAGADAQSWPCGIAVTGSCYAKALSGTGDECTDYTGTNLSTAKSTCIGAASFYGTWSDKPCQSRFAQGCLLGSAGQPGCSVEWANPSASFGNRCAIAGGTLVVP